MPEANDKRTALRAALSKGIAFTAPLMIAVAALAGGHALVSDATGSDSGYYMLAAAEGEAEAEGQAEGEAEAEAEGEAEGEAEAEAEADAEAEAEAN
jgi:hypothetical protein